MLKHESDQPTDSPDLETQGTGDIPDLSQGSMRASSPESPQAAVERSYPPHFSVYEDTRLENGVRLLTVPIENSPGFSVLFVTPYGGRDEEGIPGGITHFLEHMLCAGAGDFATGVDRDSRVDELGGSANARTNSYSTEHYITVPAESALEAVKILADQLFDPKFEPAEIEAQRGAIQQERMMYQGDPLFVCYEKLDELLYEGSTLELPAIGTEDSINAITRDDLVERWKSIYQPDNVVVVCAGAVTPEVRAALESEFGSRTLPKAEAPAAQTTSYGKERLIVTEMERPEVIIEIAIPGLPEGDRDTEAAKVLSKLVGGGLSSRLGSTIREREGLTYSIRAGYISAPDSGIFVVSTSTAPEKAQHMINRVREELARVLEDLSDDEVSRAKSSLRGNAILDLQSASSVAGTYMELATKLARGLDGNTPQQWLEKIDQVQTEDVLRVARRLFRFDEARFSLAGPIKAEQVKIWE